MTFVKVVRTKGSLPEQRIIFSKACFQLKKCFEGLLTSAVDKVFFTCSLVYLGPDLESDQGGLNYRGVPSHFQGGGGQSSCCGGESPEINVKLRRMIFYVLNERHSFG